MSVDRVGIVSMHTSPVAQPGTADAGGMNVSILGIAAELAVRGVEVDLLTRAVGEPRSRRLLPGVTLHELPAGGTGILPKDRLPEVIDEFGEAVARLARGTRYDLLHAHYWLSGIAVLPVALELGVPLVQTFHTIAAMKNAHPGPGQAEEPERRLRSETYLAHQADAVIASSAAEASALIDLARAPADRTWVIPPGVDLALFAPRSAAHQQDTRRALGLEPDRRIAAIAGRVQPLKGHELAIEALARVPDAPVLVIAGEATPGDESYAVQLRQLAADRGVDVRFVGALHRDALADVLAAATVTLVPSYSETFGLVALESAAAGTPVVAARVGGLIESVGDAGLLVEGRDPQRWADAITAASGGSFDPRAHAERFTWAAAAASLLGVYALVGGTP